MTLVKMWIFLCIGVYLFIETTVYVDAAHPKCGPLDNPVAQQTVRIIAYKSNETQGSSKSVLSLNSISDDVDIARPSIIYIHGFLESSESPTVQTIVSAYLNRGDVNVLVVDWSPIAENIDYFVVVKHVPGVGKTVADFLINASNAIDLHSLHLVGHSLGAHIAGYIARNLNVTIPRITGLDPAFPLFYPSQCHLKPTDAEVVSALHTDGGIFGTPVNTGTVDFYANLGVSPQPGCPLLVSGFCSHQMSVLYFADSIANPRTFPSSKCIDIIGEVAEFNETVYFNDATPSEIRGAYCFSTNGNPPYVLHN